METAPYIQCCLRRTLLPPATSITTRLASRSCSNAKGRSFRCGQGTHLSVSKSTTGTADTQTQIAWEVLDLQSELEELRSRGVRIEDYDLPGLKTENGVADVGFALMAWIIDPGRNALAIMERKT